MFRLVVLLPLLVAPQGYKHVGGKNGVEVFRQMSSPVIDLYAEGDIDAPPDAVRDVLLDYPHASKVTDNVAESDVLARSGHDIVVYQRLKLPVISDRDVTLRATWGRRATTTVVDYSVDKKDAPPAKKGIVRIPTLSGHWELDPIHGGAGTHARYRVQIDLAGSVPKWMVSGGAAKNIPKLFEGLRREAKLRAPGYPVAGRTQVIQ